MSVVTSFHSTSDPNAHEKFVRWCETNQRGFFVNFHSPNDAMLHRVGCPHIANWRRPDHGDLARTEKVCGTDEEAVRQQVGSRLGKPLARCRTCF